MIVRLLADESVDVLLPSGHVVRVLSNCGAPVGKPHYGERVLLFDPVRPAADLATLWASNWQVQVSPGANAILKENPK